MGRSMAGATPKLTHADFLLFPDDGKRHELVDGEHQVTPAPSALHQRVSANLFAALHQFVRDGGLGRVYYAPLDVILSDVDVVEPDLLFVGTARASIVGDWVRGAPDLVVEIVSPSSRRQDEVLKRDLYERAGVPEYWVVDPEAETVKVFRREADRYERPLLLTARDEDSLETAQLPGFALPVVAVFAE